MKIKEIDIPHGLMLCPMAGVSDRAFRLICAENGAEYAVTEMVSAKALVYEQRGRAGTPIRTAPLCRVDDGIPTAVQLFGAEPEFMREAARLISTGEYRGFCGRLPAAIDINMGCPVRKVTSNGEGWDSAHINAPEVARAVEAAGAAALCVHARTREQLYAPGIDPDVIARVKEAVTVPVFGNGDITTADDAVNMKKATGCDGVGIARGAIGDPWLFGRIAAAFDGRDFTEPTPEELIGTAIRHARLTVEFKGEKRGIAEAKPQIARYIRGVPGAVKLRDGIIRAATLDEVEEKLRSLLS